MARKKSFMQQLEHRAVYRITAIFWNHNSLQCFPKIVQEVAWLIVVTKFHSKGNLVSSETQNNFLKKKAAEPKK